MFLKISDKKVLPVTSKSFSDDVILGKNLEIISFRFKLSNGGKTCKVVACAAAGLFVSNSGFNRLRISA